MWEGSGAERLSPQTILKSRFGRAGGVAGAVVVDGERQPKAEHRDVDGEGVFVDAVDVAADHAQLQLVQCLGVVDQLAVVKKPLQLDQLMQHAEKIRAASAGRIQDRDGF